MSQPMTDSMIDRIADIVHDVANDAYHEGTGRIGLGTDDKYVARLILEAMREPTEAMTSPDCPAWNYGGMALEQVWQAMIDAALAETPE